MSTNKGGGAPLVSKIRPVRTSVFETGHFAGQSDGLRIQSTADTTTTTIKSAKPLNQNSEKEVVVENVCNRPLKHVENECKQTNTISIVKGTNQVTSDNKTSLEAKSSENLIEVGHQAGSVGNVTSLHHYQVAIEEGEGDGGDHHDESIITDDSESCRTPLPLPSTLFCRFCPPDEHFTTFQDLRHHDRTVHTGVKPYLCTFIGCTGAARYATKAQIDEHIALKHHRRDVWFCYMEVDKELIRGEREELISWIYSEAHQSLAYYAQFRDVEEDEDDDFDDDESDDYHIEDEVLPTLSRDD